MYVIVSVQNIKTEVKFLYFIPHFLCSSLKQLQRLEGEKRNKLERELDTGSDEI